MNKLRSRMVLIVFFAVLCVFILMSGLIASAVWVYGVKQADELTQLMSENKGKMPKFGRYNKAALDQSPSENELDSESDDSEWTEAEEHVYPMGYDEETAFRTRYFVVYMSLEDENQVKKIDMDHIAAINETEAQNMVAEVLKRKSATGYVEEFRYRVVEGENGRYVIFLDRAETFQLRRMVILLTVLVSSFFTVMITVIFAIVSKRVVKPFEENSKKQKQFITDASHELKTPLAIISANAEVLEYKNGKNDWTQNIVDQTKAMGKLINQLLVLTRLEEMGDDLVMEKMDLAEVVRNKAETFQEVANQKKAELKMDLPEQLMIVSGRDQMTQLISILTENATKYVTEGGEIRISLRKTGRFAVLEVYNTAEIDPHLDYRCLFDRFYRTDKSRSSQTGGHGIGLSIARKIVTSYGGRISASPSEQGIIFRAEIAANLRGIRKKGTRQKAEPR